MTKDGICDKMTDTKLYNPTIEHLQAFASFTIISSSLIGNHQLIYCSHPTLNYSLKITYTIQSSDELLKNLLTLEEILKGGWDEINS